MLGLRVSIESKMTSDLSSNSNRLFSFEEGEENVQKIRIFMIRFYHISTQW